jgi:hypothetical protein
MNALDIYNEFRKQTMFFSKGIYPKPVKNIENIKNQKQLVHFEKFAKMIEYNNGLIDWKIYIKSLADFYEGWFNPQKLTSLKSIKIYKTYIAIKNASDDPEQIYQNILESIKFVLNYCNKRNYTDFDSYVFENSHIYPTILKHFNAGSISENFLVLIPNIKMSIKSFPKDCVDEYANSFVEEYDIIRSKTINCQKVQKILSIDFNKRMNSLIDKSINK